MRVFLMPGFARFANREKIGDELLAEAIKLAEGGVIDTDFGDGVIRQWIGHPQKGRGAGFHTLIAYRPYIRAVFLHAFPRNSCGDVEPDELESLKLIAEDLLTASSAVIEPMMSREKLILVNYDEKET